MTALAGALVAVFALLASVHVYWAFGGRLAVGSAIPEEHGKPSFQPGRLATLAVACALAACAALVAAVAGLVALPVPSAVLQWGAFALAVVLLARAIGDFRLLGFFKRVRGSRFARLDSWVYSPLCLALAAAVLAVAWRS